MMSLEEARALVRACTEPRGGQFYRKLYGMDESTPALDVRDAAEWFALPYVTKDALIAVPLEERLFIPKRDVDHIRTSSGTSGKPPLFSPRTELRGMDYRLEYHDFQRPTLAFTVPAMPHWHNSVQSSETPAPRTISFDPKYPQASVRLAKTAGVDSMSLFAFHIPLVAELMKAERINEHIRFIEICGEACTAALYEYLRATFPNATLIPFYGSSEIEDSPIGMPCRAITGELPLSVYHGKVSHYLEIVEPETLASIEPKSGSEGELVITAFPGEPASFPMIRYRTGDFVRVVEESCAKHGAWSFTVLGRVGMDFVKLPGGVLRADEIERVLRELSPRVSDLFEMHLREVRTKEAPKLAAVLHLSAAPNEDLESLAQEIAKRLRVAPGFTYADGAAAGRYEPLKCLALESRLGSKSKRIIHDPD